ncbi:MAG: GNAT family N-acetyltransferase [Cytophagaceae bacterium]|nr:GNAT family N-acetyltransferase [Cytophagaceae bacterium]
MEYIFERINEQNLKDLIPLFKSAFNQDISLDFIKKKYDTYFANGKKHIGFIAYDADRNPAAYYGVFPLLIKYKDRIILAAQSGDTMTHKNHQGKGLFTKLALKTYELAKTENIEFVFGFPSASSYPGFVKKLSWIHNGNMQKYRFIVPTLPLAETGEKIPLLGNISNRLFNAFIKDKIIPYERLEASTVEQNKGGIYRSKEYYQYKSFSGCFLVKFPEGKVWIKNDVGIKLGDIWCETEQQLEKIIGRLKKLAFLSGINRIDIHVNPGSKIDKFLSSKNKATEGLPIGYVNFTSNIPLEKIQYMLGDFDTF